ncbi:MAG: EFR1 family ferrodoxin [Christensenellales bacterium]
MPSKAKLSALYFSPTGSAKKAAVAAAGAMAEKLGAAYKAIEHIDYTQKANRDIEYRFSRGDIAVFAMPVYAGRIPNIILPALKANVIGNATYAVPICVYGNRSYGDALRELILLLEQNGFLPISAAAMVSEHAFSDKIAKNRPDQADLALLRAFAQRTAEKLIQGKAHALDIDRKKEIEPYYTPLKAGGERASFLKAKPVTDKSRCTRCGICAAACPMQSIRKAEPCIVEGICIKCQACIKCCPNKAKHFDDADFLSHVKMLENNYAKPNDSLFMGN